MWHTLAAQEVVATTTIIIIITVKCNMNLGYAKVTARYNTILILLENKNR